MKNKPDTRVLRDFLNSSPPPTRADIGKFVQKWPHLTSGQMAMIFLHIMPPDGNFKTDWISTSELAEIHSKFSDYTGQWRVELKRIKGYTVERFPEKGEIEKVRINGWKDPQAWKQYIRKDIHDEVCKHRCVCCGSMSSIQCDHKDGRKDDPRVGNKDTQRIDDFQSLCQHCNIEKKSTCEKCKATGMRPDGRDYGFPIGWTEGGQMYDEVHKCHGCPCYDFEDFKRKVYSTTNNTTERLNMNITPDTHYFTCSTEVYMKLLECFITHPDKSFQMETLPALVKGHCSGDAARALFGVSTEQCHHEDEAPVKPSSGSTAKKNPGKKPIEVGFKNNHLYRNEKDGCIIECTDNSSFTGNAKFYAFDFTGVVDKPDGDKIKKLKEIQSFSSHYRIIHGTTNGTYWHSKSNEWKDLGLKSEYNPPASVVERAAA